MKTAPMHFSFAAPVHAASRSYGLLWVRWLAIGLCAVGVGVWGGLILAPGPRVVPPSLEVLPDGRPDLTAATQWFGGQKLRAQILVSGVIASGGGAEGTAILSINGASAKAFRVGEALAPGVTLVTVSANGVTVDQDGVLENILIIANSQPIHPGIVTLAK